MASFISEDNLEQALLQRLQHIHGFDVLDCYTAKPENLNDGSQRTDKRDVILPVQLKKACVALNPSIPERNIDDVIERVMNRRKAMSPIAANRELYDLIRDGVPVQFDDEQGIKQYEKVRLVHFDDPIQNNWLAVSQLWIKSIGQAPKATYRRPDVILYINGLPLVFVELKNSNVKLRNAFEDNLRSYRHDIPQLFHCNAFCMLSNALETRIGSFTAGWEHFFNWFRVKSENEAIDRKKITEQATSLEQAANGLCEPSRMLDYIENFILFHKGETKIIAQNHQFLGVNNAFKRFQKRREHDGKLGVF